MILRVKSKYLCEKSVVCHGSAVCFLCGGGGHTHTFHRSRCRRLRCVSDQSTIEKVSESYHKSAVYQKGKQRIYSSNCTFTQKLQN